MLSLSWPGTTCVLKHCTALGRPNYFGLHGLWPEYKMNCGNVHWSGKDLSDENRRDLPLYWNSMYNSEMGFINHELSKHATCWQPRQADPEASPSQIVRAISHYDLGTLNGKLNAFIQVAITWSKNHDLFRILEENGIFASDEQNVSSWDIVKTFEEHFGVRNSVFLICQKRHGGKNYFSEIRFCLNDNYQVESCGEDFIQKHMQYCGEEVLYPRFPELEEQDQLKKSARVLQD